MPRVVNCETTKNMTVSLGQSPLGPPGDCPIWSITSPGGRGHVQVHPSVTAGTAYGDINELRNKPDELYKVNTNGVENPAFYDTETAGYPPHLRPFKTFSSSGGSGTLKKQFHQYNNALGTLSGGARGGAGSRPEKRSWLRWWKLRFRKSATSTSSSEGCCCCRPRSRCPLAAVIGVTLLLVLLVAGLAVVLYLTVGGGLQAFADYYDDEGCWAVEGEFRITNRAFLSDMSDPSTSAFGALASEVVRSLDELFFQSSLVKDYNGSDIGSFRHGSVIVVCRVFLNRAILNGAQQVGMAFMRGLEEGHGTLPAGNLQVDITSLKFTDLRDVYPPPKSSREIPIPDAAWSQWSDWSTCKDALGRCDFRQSQTRSRDCRIDNGYGDALPNDKVCRKNGGNKVDLRDCVCTDNYNNNPVMGPTSQTHISSSSIEPIGNAAENSKAEIDGILQPVKIEENPVEIGTTVSESIMDQSNPVTQPISQFPSTPLPYVGSKLATERASVWVSSAANTIKPFVSTTPKMKVAAVTASPRMSEKVHPCDGCKNDEICFVESDASQPKCVVPRDDLDPRGCGGYCSGEHDVCRKVDHIIVKCVDASECVQGEWKCGNGLCIPEARRCDGHFNCFDSTDERNCECKPDEFHCGNHTSCLPNTLKCNGIVECWDGKDETNCTQLCPSNQFMCNGGQCIPKNNFCDRFKDCKDGSDEPSGCEAPCSSHMFQCANKRCIHKLLVCNGLDNCGDRSDERLCPASYPNNRPVYPRPSSAPSSRETRHSNDASPNRDVRPTSDGSDHARRVYESTYLPVWKET